MGIHRHIIITKFITTLLHNNLSCHDILTGVVDLRCFNLLSHDDHA